MPVAVIGMHRSGTSMITRMLANAGLQVGPSSELLAATAENPTGYWERRPMVLLNDAVMDVLGMAWDHVPALPTAGWVEDPRLRAHHAEAARIVASFPTDRTWGWKDPRTSITLPFWEASLPAGEQATTVLCVRNPLDVAQSLARRGGTSPRLAFWLWRSYSSSALELARARRGVVTHYDAYFEDAQAELRRVCDAVGLEPSEGALREAAAGADTAHRHAASGLAALVRSSADDETVALYLELLALTGPVMATVAGRDEMVVSGDGAEVDREETIAFVREYRAQAGTSAAADTDSAVLS